MKKLFFIALCVMLAYTVNAQDKEDVKKANLGKLTRTDRVVLDLFSDIWMGATTDSMKVKKINRGANAYFMFEFPFGTSNFSFAPGIGIGCTNLYSDAMPVKSYTIDTITGAKDFDGTTVFKRIPATAVDGQKISVKNNKFTAIYLDIPLEFRYRTKNSAFKFYLGGKIGLMLSNHNKYNGTNFYENSPTGTILYKEYKIANVEAYRYGATVRIGWKWIQAYGYYSLSHLFKKDKGPDMYPISIGITVSPY